MFGWITVLIRDRQHHKRCDKWDATFLRRNLRSEALADKIESDSIRSLVEAYDQRIRLQDEEYCRQVIREEMSYISKCRDRIAEHRGARYGFNLSARFWAWRDKRFWRQAIERSEVRAKKALESLNSDEISVS